MCGAGIYSVLGKLGDSPKYFRYILGVRLVPEL